ncbi:MAG TPA: hypothetical protein VHS07_04520 [Candidatus Binataceae bacterium]|jgi:hypothetical protein|nr:hypothetical protein [Candidatus Binataceae bacterium]
MVIRSVVLWIHVLCGVAWVGTCASFLLAASAMTAESGEWRDFALRAAPRINRINVVPALVVPMTGAGNLFSAALMRRTPFPPVFIGIVAIKVVLFFIMGLVLAASFAAERSMREGFAVSADGGMAAARHLVRLYGTVATLGMVALGLGLWLAGT